MHLLALVGHSDEVLSDRVRSWRTPGWLRAWMRAATRLGDGWGWLIAAAVLAGGGPRLRPALLAVAVAAAVTNVLQVPLKRCVRRRRPCADAPAGWDGYSFPSGHTMNAFSLATVLSLLYPALGAVVGFLGASIGASRVVLGRHYAGDVLAGAILGLAIGATAYRLVLG
jgi:undecaprenyl-diphosphatase